MVKVYTKKGIAYNIIMHTFIFYEMSRLQYNLSIGCSTILHKYGIIIAKFRMLISVTMEMEKLSTGIFQKYTHIYTHSHMHTHIHIPYINKFW